MAQSNEDFVRDLFALVNQRRSFGRHPTWLKVQDGGVPRESMRQFAAQFFLHVREFPRALSALHSRCYNAGERVKIAESLYEEETGAISGSAPHPELFIRLGLGLGMAPAELTDAQPLPSTAALIDWFELSTKDRVLRYSRDRRSRSQGRRRQHPNQPAAERSRPREGASRGGTIAGLVVAVLRRDRAVCE